MIVRFVERGWANVNLSVAGTRRDVGMLSLSDARIAQDVHLKIKQ